MSRIRVGMACLGLVVGLLCVTVSAAAAYEAAGWGADGSGQLGDGSTTGKYEPVQAQGLSEVTEVAAGADHTLALLSNGTVEAWGDNAHGQLGNGSTTSSLSPVSVSGLSHIVAIAAGTEFSLALEEGGKVFAWGYGARGRLGDGGTADSHVPVELEIPHEAVGISAGPEEAFAVLSSGKVKAWGDNAWGKLGDGEFGGYRTSPVNVEGVSEATAVAAGGSFGMALLSSGKVVTWGENALGQLGTGSTEGPSTCVRYYGFHAEEEKFGCSDAATNVAGLSGVTKIAAGANHALALLSGGTVEAWGENDYGQLGDGTDLGPNSCFIDWEPEIGFPMPLFYACATSPVAVSEVSSATAVAAGTRHSLALTSSGAVKAWGSNEYGQIGTVFTPETPPLGTWPFPVAINPVTVTGVGGVLAISAGSSDSFSIGPPIPTITAVSPSTGPGTGATTVTIEGTHFKSVSAVRFGATNAASFTVNSETSITAVSPTHKLGTVNVTVATPDGTTATIAADRFTYVPEALGFGRCVKSGYGRYKNTACTESLEGGGHEWNATIAKTGVTFTDGTETVEKVVKPRKVIFETGGKVQLACEDMSGSGEFLGTSALADVSIVLTGCEYGGSACTSAGAHSGEVLTATLTGTLGWREKAGNAVGLALAPLVEKGNLVEAVCGSSVLRISGSVIGTIGPVNNMNSTFNLKFKESKGVQAVERFEGEAVQELRMSISGGWSVQTGLSMETVIGSEEEVEIDTVA